MKGSKQRILNHLRTHKGISSMEAFELYGITRLSARIKELREMGYDIATLMTESVNRYGESVRYGFYVLKGELDGK